ncbi:TonB-dependent receptor [Chitinophaga pendula]|uniref:TonB-dependent receptor domain-containing protein n=1 Tax=Chitinophaga TaxID=79328 RepID=UPI000BAF64E9|nr:MULTISPECIES: TonB-dependent receptor [Chitinophaga]ASZ13552.1 hypothetical protein CK934_22655 [Chitinophaga sp. MD30]UCJ08815.1 TonB-dependent receptor [Chitinophaga pendula]
MPIKFLYTLFLYLIACLGLTFSVSRLQAQERNGHISGTIHFADGQPAAGVTVRIARLDKATSTDENGRFHFTGLPVQTYRLTSTMVGYIRLHQEVRVTAGQTVTLDLTMERDESKLQEVSVAAKSEVRRAKEQGFSINSIDARRLHNTTRDINQVLNRTTGIRIREEGGLGSNYSFTLNGFSGKQIKFFVDGVPIDNFGSALSLNNIPINLAERIEVYKGVVPISLGADALGGAVNVITNQGMQHFLDVSYSYGSFNTHRASFSARHTTEKGFTINASAAHNYADNNFKVDVQIPDETGKFGPVQRIRRFHDAYQATMGQVELGVTGKPYADRLFIGLIAAGNKKDIQTGMTMEDVVGQAYNSSESLIPTLKYKKRDLFTKGLSLVVNANYSFVKSRITDSSSRHYDWLGNYTIKTVGSTSGEINFNKTLFRFNDRNAVAMANLNYQLNDHHQLSLNYTYNRFRRVGEDPISKYPIAFQHPSILSKQIGGLGYQYTTTDKKLIATVFGKLFRMSAVNAEAGWGNYKPLSASYTKPGYGAAAAYFVLPFVQVKASYENTWRLPEGEEMFGNGLLIEDNPNLKPEHSHNANFGLLVSKTLRSHRLEGELNLLYRLSGDFIRQEATGPRGRYMNVDSVRTTGVEWTVKYGYKDIFTFELNGTYQNTLNVKKLVKGIRNYAYWDRIPNVPYYFGNVDVAYNVKKPFRKDDVFTITAGGTFVEEFYLFWPSQGDPGDKFVIPRQMTAFAGLTYAMMNGRYNITAECLNLGDAKVYDNFRLQKPGRSFNMKLRYFIH